MTTSNIASYYWNRNVSNTWSESQLNTVNLNINYLNNIGSTWSSKIANHQWHVGGNTRANIMQSATPKTAYTNEIISPAELTTYTAKIGLMYVSDYGYAVSPDNWNTTIDNYGNDTNRNNNWVFMGLSEWTITRMSDLTGGAFSVNTTGDMTFDIGWDTHFAVRSSFYLESSVTYVSGSGTATDPFRIT